ncbi:MAG TPA: adenosine deaminase [Rariglobus sp.]|jgi:adenosine deaminase|nr:adenosine deaminase [Rariglobus sp.]
MVFDDFIQSLPKTETHLHIEGALPYELLHAWKPDSYPLNPSFHASDFRFEAFPKFDEVLLGHALPWFVSAERYREAARAVFAKHVAQNVRYVEISFHLPVAGFINTPAREIIAAIRSAVPAGLEVRIFAGMLRTDYAGPMRAVIDDLENWDELAGVDLHGFEQVPTEAWTEIIWARLRAAGKITKAHAGEFDGAHRVREAIEQLGATRIQHGVRAVEDPAVVALAAERGVTFDVCPISNVRLRVVPSMNAHPLRALMQAGVRCTISTDDPLVFSNSVNGEYLALSQEAGFSCADIGTLVRNGWEVADVSPTTRARMFAEIDRFGAESR